MRVGTAPALLMSVGAVLLSCAKEPTPLPLHAAIEKLQSGETIREIEESGKPASPSQAEVAPELEAQSPLDLGTDDYYSRLRGAYLPIRQAQTSFQEFRKKKDGKPRNSFTNEELAMLQSLATRSGEVARNSGEELLKIVSSHPASSPREELIAILAQSESKNSIRELRKTFDAPPEVEFLPIFPFGIAGLLPKPGAENSPVSRRNNPFAYARKAWLSYSDEPALLESRIEAYAKMRDRDNPDWLKADFPNAVKIALLDSGIDFVKLPELGEFLGESKDFSDDDENPWIPLAGSGFSHGSATSATLLSLTASVAPELLKDRKIQIHSWKILTVRQLLSRASGPHGLLFDDVGWESRPAIQNAVLAHAANAPDIILVSLGFSIREKLFSTDPMLLKNTSSLWVMAAGNSGEDARISSPTPCFLDLPAEYRPRDQILCVGAARMGANGPEIAEFSNHGPAVDFYVLDSFEKRCPSGTSCSAPAAAAAAAMLAAKFPQLDARALRTVLRRASKLYVTPQAVYRYFDPTTMMPRAFNIADQLTSKR